MIHMSDPPISTTMGVNEQRMSENIAHSSIFFSYELNYPNSKDRRLKEENRHGTLPLCFTNDTKHKLLVPKLFTEDKNSIL